MTRYVPARYYLWFGLAAAALSGVAGWLGWNWLPLALVASGLLAVTAGLLMAMFFRPAIEIHEGYFSVGKRVVPWIDVRRLDILRLDRTGWISPLIVRVTLFDDTRFMLIYPGDLEECSGLLRNLRRLSRDALIDGIPYRQYWGEVLAAGGRQPLPGPRYRILRPEDEAEVERLYQRLKSVGHLDQKNTPDEK
ncbi:MAG TPA: hypothetical protein VHW24_02025 [Bryobacteraceae bacterium]|jgi:hypothetical protein|nr:hypothetical protein [Bryobacteraceae bacterium]